MHKEYGYPTTQHGSLKVVVITMSNATEKQKMDQVEPDDVHLFWPKRCSHV